MGITVITGGQTGVDRGGADAARNVGLEWEMLFPKGFKCEDGEANWPKWVKAEKGKRVKELRVADYAERTKAVSHRARAIIIIEHPDKMTPGTKLTLELNKEQPKHIWRFMNVKDKAKWKAEAHAIAYWLRSLLSIYEDFELMIAGPREGKWQEAESVAFGIMVAAFQAVKGDA